MSEGYVPEEVRRRIRTEAGQRCGYCLTQTEALDPLTGDRVRLFDPRRRRWAEYFSWSEDGTRVLGRTPCGRATVLALRLNNLIAVMVRRAWVSAGWHPPQDSAGPGGV